MSKGKKSNSNQRFRGCGTHPGHGGYGALNLAMVAMVHLVFSRAATKLSVTPGRIPPDGIPPDVRRRFRGCGTHPGHGGYGALNLAMVAMVHFMFGRAATKLSVRPRPRR